MNQEKNSKATTNSGRIFENCVFQNPDLSVLCPDGVTLPPEEKTKRLTASLFFFSSSKEQGNLSGNPKIPCPAGQLPFSPSPGGRRFEVAMDNLFPHASDGYISGVSGASLSFHLPMVAFRYGFPLETDIPATVSNFQNLKA